MNKLEDLLVRMETMRVVPDVLMTGENILILLARRDESEFDEVWLAMFRKIESLKQNLAHNDAVKNAKPTVDRIRELAYLQAYKNWKSPELAACVSDDFGLIGDALAMEMDETWITELLHEYLCGRIPPA